VSSESRIRVLVLHAHYTDQLSYFDDWLDALNTHPQFGVVQFNILHSPRELRRHLGEVDAVIALHSTNGDTTVYLERHAPALADRRAPLITFVGNEVNLPNVSISAKRKLLGQIRPQWIATQLLQEAGEFLFGDLPSLGVVSVPHALNAKVFWPDNAGATRPIDLGTRFARYAPHLGDDDRNRIADRFVEIGRLRNFTIDISNQRFDRIGWAGFLNRCRGTVSSEAGSWFLERDDLTVAAIRRYMRERSKGREIASDAGLLLVGSRLPPWLRRAVRRVLDLVDVRFEHDVYAQPQVREEIHQRFFAGRARPSFYGKCLSSRHFDAVGTKTCQIMFRGRFNDILEADRHYLALDYDFNNLDDVLRRFADERERVAVTEMAHAHVLAGHTYQHRMQQIEDLLRKSS
jgi:Glycosyl transferases group 1